MKRIICFMLCIIMVFALTIGCSPKPAVEQTTEKTTEPATSATTAQSTEQPTTNTTVGKFKDGVYFAIDKTFPDSGWKSHMIVTVENGNIVEAIWNGTHRVPTQDKITVSAEGNYGMVAFGKAQSEWHEQAAATSAFLIKSQDTKLGLKPDGTTDAIAGVTIKINEFYDLVDKALDSTPVPKGKYKDGYPMSALTPDANGWQDMSQFIVVNGTIVDANYNSQSITQLDTAGKPLDKRLMGADYGLVKNGGAAHEWDEYADMIGAYVVQTQGFDVVYKNNEGYSDTIAGVTIHIKEMDELFKKAFGL